jgi:uncharacterized protein (TIRG00374 family)
MQRKRLKKLLSALVKISLSLAIVGYLIWNSTRGKDNAHAFTALREQPKDWGLLAAAWAACTLAVLLTFFRWWRLVRVLGVPCRFSEAMRISFWGYLFNLAPLGIVGGDLVKAVMLAHHQPDHRAKAVASVLADRLIGLYMLFVVAAAAIWFSGLSRIDSAEIRWICQLTVWLAIVGGAALAVLMLSGTGMDAVIRAAGRIPRLGPPLESLLDALRMYRRRPLALAFAALLSVGVHCSFAVGCWLIACGLPGNHLSLSQHFVAIPLSSAAGVLPLPLGPFEAVLDFLYANVPVIGPAIAAGQGLVVALAYRLITVLIAALGAYYYFGSRREIAEAMEEG